VDPIAIELLAILILLMLSALFSGTETALTSLSNLQAMKAIEEGRHARILKLWLEHPNHVISSLLVGNNIVNITISSLATDLAYRAFGNLGLKDVAALAVSSAIGLSTLVVLVFGEITPKTYARHNAMRFLGLSPVFLLLDRVLSLIARAMAAIVTPIVRAFGGRTQGTNEVTGEDIEYMIRVGGETGGLDTEQKELLSSAMEFSETLVREIMVPRMEIVAYDIGAPLEELYGMLSEHQFSRYPVYRNDLDHVVGIFYTKDLLLQNLKAARTDEALRAPFDVAGLLHEAYLVPDSKKASDLLKDFQARKLHFAVVVDEFGGTVGIVTMEDLLEELVGEIYDEFDVQEALVRELPGKRALVNARIELDALKDALGLALPEDPSYTTLGGFVTSQMGTIPERGQWFVYNDTRFTVRDRDERRVKTVEVSRKERSDA
jgi:CBS domain containing-hemolysin-like protein